MPEKRVTLADIARRDGSHVTTVSLALRNSPKLPQTTRERIQNLAEEMGYVPDPALRALVRYRRGKADSGLKETIAYITNWTSRWGWQQHAPHALFYEGAKAAAAEMGYQLDHFWLSENGLTDQRMSKILESRGIRGAIIASHSRQMEHELQLDWNKLCGIKIDFFPHRPQLPSVSNHQSLAARVAFQKALAAGWRRIGLLMHRGWDMTVDRMWSAGFLVEQATLPEADRIPPCYFPDAHPKAAWERETEAEVQIEPDVFKKWYETWKPEVVIGHAGFLKNVAADPSYAIGERFQLIDLFLTEPNPEIAGIIQNHRSVGAAAVDLLATRLLRNETGTPPQSSVTFIEGTWNEGGSLSSNTKVK